MPYTQKKNTIIFFDWDDTLIPSSFLAENGLRLDSEQHHLDQYIDELKSLEKCVKTVLTMAQKLGKVIIVTNAENGWVQLSSKVSFFFFCLLIF